MNDVDPIVDEVRRIREAHAARFNYDLRAIFEDIKEQQKRSGRTFVSPPKDQSTIAAAGDFGSQANQPSQSVRSAADCATQPSDLIDG